MDNTFIYTHRKLLDHPVGKKPNYLAVWMYLLLKANHAPNDIIVNNELMHIKRGEHLGSMQIIAKHFSLSVSNVKKIIDFFERQRMLNTSRTRYYTKFQIVNYDQYQHSEHLENTSRTVRETNNNDNNENITTTDLPDKRIIDFANNYFGRIFTQYEYVNKWLSAGITEEQIIEMIKVKGEGQNVNTLKYFDGAIMDLTKQKGNKNGTYKQANRNGDRKIETEAQRIQRIRNAGK